MTVSDSGSDPSPAPGSPPGSPAGPKVGRRRTANGWALDLLWAAALLVPAGALAGVVWNWWAVPPTYRRIQDNAVMDQAQLAHRMGADGRFVVIGLLVGVVAGFVLTWRRQDAPLRRLLIGVVVAVAAGYLALQLGTQLGRVPASVGRGTPVGQTFPDSLHVISGWVLLAWPFGYLLASTTLLWSRIPSED